MHVAVLQQRPFPKPFNRPKFARARQMPYKRSTEGFLDEKGNPEIYLARGLCIKEPIVNVFRDGEPVQSTLRVLPSRKVRYIPSHQAFVEYSGRIILKLARPLSSKAIETLSSQFGIPSATC